MGKVFTKAGVAAAAAVLALGAASAFSATPAGATGVVMIRQANGHTDVYRDVVIKAIHGALYMTSADGKGTLVVHRASCSYQGELMVCFPTSVVLVQAGKTSPIDLRSGTIYVNRTGDPQQLVLSTTKVPPHSVMVSISTKRGTYVNLVGRIDKAVQ